MAKAKAFDKFINKPVKGAKVKEAFRQEKKAAIKERREAIEKRFEEKRQQKQAQAEGRQQTGNFNDRAPVSRSKPANKSQGPRAKSGGSTTGKTWQKRETRDQTTEGRAQSADERTQRPAAGTGWQKVAANRQSSGSENFRPQSRPASGTSSQRPTGNRTEGNKKTISGNRSSSAQRPAYPPKPAGFVNPKVISDQSRNPSYGKPVVENRGQKAEGRPPHGGGRPKPTGNGGQKTAGSRQSAAGRPKSTDNRRETSAGRSQDTEYRKPITDNSDQKPAYKPKTTDNRKETTNNLNPAPRRIEPKVQKPFASKRSEEIGRAHV